MIVYNSIIHKAYGKTPYEVIFGWKMHCIYDIPVITTDNIMINDIIPSDYNSSKEIVEQHLLQIQQT